MISCPICGTGPELGGERVRYCRCRRLRGYLLESDGRSYNWEFSIGRSILAIRPSLILTVGGWVGLYVPSEPVRPVKAGHEESVVAIFLKAALCDEVLET